jgi:hypothetical protein
MMQAPFRFGPTELLFGLICFIPALLVGLAVGAVILRAACGIYNSLVGGEYSDSGVPGPSFGWAMVIVLVNAIVSTTVNAVLLFASAMFLQEIMAGQAPWMQQILLQGASLPISFLINASFVSIMLPSTFGRSAVIVLIEYLIILLIIAVIFATLFFVGMGMRIR